MDTLNDIDKEQLSQGFDAGNYANAYETTDYEVARDAISGETGFWRIGHLLGFFSSYSVDETPDEWRDEVEYYRAELSKQGLDY